MDTITVAYELRQELAPDVVQWNAHAVELPDWCSGDPEMALALYFFGYRQAVTEFRNVTIR